MYKCKVCKYKIKKKHSCPNCEIHSLLVSLKKKIKINKVIENFSAQDEWVGMPEFIQEKKEPFSKIIFRFENEKDLNKFAKRIKQKLTPKTKSAWYPFKPHRGEKKGRYIYEP